MVSTRFKLMHRGMVASLAMATVLGACSHRLASPASQPAAAPFSMMTLPPDIGLGTREKVVQADRLWEQRLDPNALAHAVAAWQDLLAQDPTDERSRGALMRAYLFSVEGPLALGDHQQSIQATLQNALVLAEEGLAQSCPTLRQRTQTALPALAELPALCGTASPQWMLWYSAALTHMALASDVTVLLTWQKPLVALWQDLVARGGAAGDAHAYLGVLLAHAPAFAGGNMAQAQEHFEQAMRLQPAALQPRVWYTEYVLVPRQMRAASEQLLRQIVATEVPKTDQTLPEQEISRLRARLLLERLDDLL